ncbi:polycystin-1-like isoform 4-T5 [Macrochelys suwanniensis]
MEARALCPSWVKQGCPSAPGAACSSIALLFGVLLLCSLSTGSKPEGAPAVKPAMMGLKAAPPKQLGAGRCRTDPGTGNDRGLAYSKEGATRTQASEGAGVEGLGGGKRMATAARARCRKGSEESPVLEEATPCLASCVCTSLAANCSRSGLAEVPPGEPRSWTVTVLDLSHNHLSNVRAGELAGYPSLQVLDLSYNCIRTIEEGAFRHLGRLQSLKLVSNRLVCSCSLRWLGAWVREKGPLVSDAELLHCFQPAASSSIGLLRVDFSALTCAADFISCVKDPETGRETVLLYSYLHPGPQSQASCHALCSQKAHTHYGLDLEDRCLCGSLGSEEAMDCGKVCANEIRSQVCNRTVVHAVYPVQVSLSLSVQPHYSLHEVIEFTAETPLLGTLYAWDFGDGGEQFSSSSPRARHTYALPGVYVVTVRAQAAGRSLLHRAAVSVILPVGPVGIKCPRAVGRGESINIGIHTRQGTDLSVLWRMKMPSGQETLDESSCSQGGRIHLQNLNCYWLSHAKETWQDARRLCQGVPGGDLAVVRTQEVQRFLQETFSGAGVVWIGLSSLGSLRWVNGSLVDSFQNWTPFGQPEQGKESCVQMHLLDSEGVWSSSPCSAKSSFLCERRAGVTLPSPDVFLTGMPVFSGVYDVRNVSTEQLPPLLGPGSIELMLFPGLWFSHAGILVSVDFGVQGTKKPVLVRFQILRPHCNPNQHLVPPGCELLHTPFACCHPRPLCNTTGWCPSGQQWCPLREGCLNISSPCSSYAFENVTSSILPIRNPPRYRGTPPFYSPVADFPLLLTPSSANRHIHVLLPREEIGVHPDDVIGIQHNAEVSSLLRCLPHSHSPWRQSYVRLVKAGWWEGSISSFTNPTWVDHVVCDLRVTFVGETRRLAAPPRLARHSERGAYAYTATVRNAVSSRQVNCTVEVQTKVGGLQIIHPTPVSGKLHVATKRETLIVVKMLSGCNAVAHWMAPVGKAGVLFEATCPGSIAAHVPACRRDTTDTWFSSALLRLEEPRMETLNVLVSNEISSQKLSVKLQSYNAIEGLRVVPPGPRRMLVDVSQVFSAELTQGSSVSYSWVIDNMDMFAYNGQTYSVKFKRPATYQLKLRAENPVSSEVVEVALTAEAMNPLANPEIVGLPGMVAVDTLQTLVFRVEVDTAMEVTVRWGFGDGSPEVESLLSPPYDSQLSRPDPRGERVQVLARVTHTYTQPGDYSVTAEAINEYDRVERVAKVRAVCPIASVTILVTPASPLANEVTQFEALPRPSPYGVVYSWNFNDGSPMQEGANSLVRHRFEKSGVYNVMLRANNSLSEVPSDVAVMVSEGVAGLRVVAGGPTELGSATIVRAVLASGTDVLWTFNMGDGFVYSNLNLSFVSHTFAKEGNYTVTVMAHNAATSTRVSTIAEVYRLQITNILAPSCLSSGERTPFQAVVTGPSKGVQFCWDFQDGNPPSVGDGDPTVFHSYLVAGSYQLNLTVRGTASTTSRQLAICVEDRIRSVKLMAPTLALALGEPTCFQAEVVPVPDPQHQYRYHWDFGVGEDPVTSGSPEITFTYLEGGSYRVTVTVWNTVSRQNASADILAQRVIGTVSILHSGEMGSFLALGTSYLFTAEVPWDSAATFLWNFGDHSPPQNVSSPWCAPPRLQGGARVTVPRTVLCRGTGYRFILTVKKPGKEPVSVAQTVWIAPGQILPVTIECRSCSALSSYEISRSVHVTLAGQCQGCDNRTVYKWMAQSSDGQPLTLDHVTTSTGDSNRDLVIRQGVLRDGVNYSFMLSASQPGGELQGGSSITLTPNNPPRGGVCTLTPEHNLYLLETLVSYQCTGWVDEDSSPGQLIYTLIAERCSPDGRHCQPFCLYRGIKSSFSTFLPAAAGGSRTTVNVLVELEDSQGAKTLALNRTLTLAMPVLPAGFPTVTSWLKNKSQSELWGVVQQGNPQEVIPYSLALITVLNQNAGSQDNEEELRDRISIRSNITAALASLSISSVKEVAQLSAALQQCVAFPGELSPESQARTLAAAQRMIEVISSETEEGHETPTSAGNSILGILGSTLSALDLAPHLPLSGAPGLSTALTAFNLTRALMKSLMRSRVLNEETLSLSVSEIRTQGKRADSPNLLCQAPSERCLFSVPGAVAGQLAESQEVVQVLMDISVNPFPFNYYANSSISTRLALLEFTTPGGAPIPVSNLSGERAIGLRLPTGQQEQWTSPPTLILLPPGESVNFTVRASAGSRAEGVHIRVGVTVQEGFDPSQEREPSIRFFGHHSPVPNEFHYAWKEEMIFDSLQGGSSREITILLSSPHRFNGTLRDYHVNITNRFSQAPVSATVTVFASLCQYFHFPSMRWSTEGLRPTAATNRKEIVCLTEHLTVFGASLFVPPHSILFLPPSKRARQAPLVVITCCVLFAIYLGMVLIAHKLDDIDVTRVGIIPRCGQPGRYKYWVMVKTGWKRGSGTTAHVGISLYGLNKSGSRHLDKGWAFQRNSQDIFQVETDANLGEIWKIRVWHDNTGLDPSWYLQHVIVWDRQTDHMYFFLVDDWLSVENEKNEGLVEKEVLAACPQELRCFSRVFPAQLRLGFSDWHVWLSIWGRSPHSRFTRVQRVTCCVLAVYLFLAICVLWYGAIGVEGYSVPLGSQASVTAESIAVGMVVAGVVFPIQLLFTFIFRKTRSKVVVEDPDPPVQDSQTVEMDVCLEHADLGSSSFLSIPVGMESIMDGSSVSGESPGSRRPVSTRENLTKVGSARVAKRWPSCDSIFDVPDLLNSASQSRILKRKKALLTLGIESASSSDDDPLSLGDSEESRRDSRGHRLTRSEEDLLNSIVAETQRSSSSACVTSDSGRFSPRAEADLVSDVMESSCSAWSDGIPEQGRSDWGFLRKSFSCISTLTSPGSALLPDPEPLSAPVSSFSTRIGVSRRPLEWLFPGWVLPMTYAFIFLLLAGCFTVTILYGSSLHDHTALMWLISCVFSFITSFVLLEPLKVVLEALRAALITKPVDSDGEGLVEEPLVKPTPERIGKVRVPCGYGLLQAKEEARKVRALRALMRSCLTHMLFLLVVLTVNYQSCFHHRNIHLLHTAVRQAVTAPNDGGLHFSSVRSYTDTWEWIDSVLLSYLYNNPRLSLVGVPRLRQESSAGNVPLDLVSRPEVSRSGQADRDACSGPSLQNSSHDSIGFWIWGRVGVYHTNAGCWRELGNSSAKAQRTLADLQASNWLNKRTRAMFLEFTQYNVDVNLYVAVMLLLELPTVGPAVPSILILPYQMLRLGTGLDLPLALVISLFIFSVAFLLPELWRLSQEGASCLGQSRCWLQLLLALLSIAVGALHFAHIWLADVRLEHYWGHRQAFTSFYEVAVLARMEVCLSALLLTVTTLKIVRQLRFVRRWSAFGKTFQHALGELAAATLLFLLLLLVYAQCGYLAFSATVEEFRTFRCAVYVLLSALHGKVAFLSVIQEFPTLGTAYVLSFTVSLFCVGSRFLCAVILHSYRTVQAEVYRPAIEPQDYEMIEFFVKRFKLWMGLSKTKEFRHKVKFEGMDSLISRSSGNSKCSRLLSAGTISRCASSTISSSSEELALSESPVPEPYNVQFYLDRLPSAVNNLLDQFDRVIRVMEDVCQLERGLEQAQKRINDNKKGQRSLQGEKVAPAKQLELPRTYSTFSESALVRLRAHRAKVSNCNATDGHKLVQRPPADGIPHPVAGCTSWLVGPPLSTDLCQRLTQAPGISCKWRPKSEEGQGCLCHEVPQRQIPLKRRAWQTEGAGNM